MLGAIDTFLNKITMYRLLAYYLGTLLLLGFVYALLGWLPFNPFDLVASSLFLIAACWIINYIFARVWRVPVNAESALITALILALIISPAPAAASWIFLLGASLAAMASKYILAIKGKHIFNPAAIAVVVTAFAMNQTASWWVGGNLILMPFVIAGGLLVARKIHRFDLVLTFFLVNIIASIFVPYTSLADTWHALTLTILHSSVFFLAFAMLTEPLTTPPRRFGRIVYAAIVGILCAPWAHVGNIYFTPELALVVGNLASYLLSPSYKRILRIQDIRQIAADTYEFIFAGPVPAFSPGQYAEWTLHADRSDDRGNRRYFTIASSPTEKEMRIGVKFYARPSSYKRLMADFARGSEVMVGSIAGDFVMPRNTKKKLVFIAGGIGITPFRSMIKYVLDKKESRDIVLLYSNKTEAEIAYRELFDEAVRAGIGLRVVYTLSGEVSAQWSGERGMINSAMIARVVPDYRERIFYISGPQGMVQSFKHMLHGMGVPLRRILVDYFPGFA